MCCRNPFGVHTITILVLLFVGIRKVSERREIKKIGDMEEYIELGRRVIGNNNFVEIFRSSAENNIFLPGLIKFTENLPGEL